MAKSDQPTVPSVFAMADGILQGLQSADPAYVPPPKMIDDLINVNGCHNPLVAGRLLQFMGIDEELARAEAGKVAGTIAAMLQYASDLAVGTDLTSKVMYSPAAWQNAQGTFMGVAAGSPLPNANKPIIAFHSMRKKLEEIRENLLGDSKSLPDSWKGVPRRDLFEGEITALQRVFPAQEAQLASIMEGIADARRLRYNVTRDEVTGDTTILMHSGDMERLRTNELALSPG